MNRSERILKTEFKTTLNYKSLLISMLSITKVDMLSFQQKQITTYLFENKTIPVIAQTIWSVSTQTMPLNYYCKDHKGLLK